MEVQDELVPRNYQEKLIRIALKENSIIYLPTGSGKTFIAVCVLIEMGKQAFQAPYSQGGKISVMLVNTVALVQQHANYLRQNTPFKVGAYTGDMNVDFWDKEKWLLEYENNQILIMTAQIFSNTLSSNISDLSKVNLLIFDECHQAVEAHPMRQIMMKFQGIKDQPRVLGLTATLLNGNVKSHQVLNEVQTLETTYHGKVATVDELEHVIGFSTNPREKLEVYYPSETNQLIEMVCKELEYLIGIVKSLKPSSSTPLHTKKHDLPYLIKEKGFHKIYKTIMDAIIHIRMLGIAGGQIAIICYIIHLECDKKLCTDQKTLTILNAVISKFVIIKERFDIEMSSTPAEQRLLKHSSPKVMKLVEILLSYKQNSSEELCGLIFVQRKNTATFLYHILVELIKTFETLKFVKPDFVIGVNANPLNATRESLYYAKANKKVIDHFKSHEINLLIASNVIEEGIDVPRCTLVIKFDTPTNYREYVQSKGRARHKESLYYIMIETTYKGKFNQNYQQYQLTEQDLSNYLTGQNEIRKPPNKSDIANLYKEVPPYYVNGPGTAHVTMLSAVQMLMRYCSALQSDCYTIYEPTWYLQQSMQGLNAMYKVYVELPVVSPLLDLIGGDYFANKKDAKRSAAFKACILLHTCGELSDQLIPVRSVVDETAHEHLFTHWPEIREKDAGITKKRRVYQKMIPRVLTEKIVAEIPLYLHHISISPGFVADVLETDKYILHQLYSDDLCFGFVTSEPLPQLCSFPVYVSSGRLNITIETNQSRISLEPNQLTEIRAFHHLIFSDVICIIKNFLYMGKESSNNMLVVPMYKNAKSIAFDVIQCYKEIRNQTAEPKLEEKLNLVVDDEGYSKKIVTPWYRMENKQYIVLRVCEGENADSPFPNSDFSSYTHYFYDKYTINTFNSKQPLLLVKTLSSRLNCIKPRGMTKKRKKDEVFEDLQLRLIPEMCVKQEFPSCLWVQAKILPTILYRIVQLLCCEQIRSQIAREAGLGTEIINEWDPLELDEHLLTYKTDETNLSKPKKIVEAPDSPKEMNTADIVNSIRSGNLNRDFEEKLNDSRFPWSAEQEPKDIHRHLDVSKLDIEYFVSFVNRPLEGAENTTKNAQFWTKPQRLAINFPRDFIHKNITLLDNKINPKGPELNAIYQALATAKCNDIVNLERLETLGDSFLKLTASLFIFLKYPRYNEGQATELKSRLISNKNLFYLANKKNLSGALKVSDFVPSSEWLPPSYCVPKSVAQYIDNKEMPISSLFYIEIPKEEQILGKLGKDTTEMIEKEIGVLDEDEATNSFSSLCNFISQQMVPDKTLSDAAEALIGAYFDSNGFEGGLKFIEWLGLIPASQNLLSLIRSPVPDPIINKNADSKQLKFLMPAWITNQVEQIIGYKFTNKAFLLQALTHSSYTNNRITYSYERLEFIGDAVLDFLITTHIYESCGKLNPGELTDLRSALVNNEIFAAYVVKLGLYKHLKHYNSTLMHNISKFVLRQEAKNFAVNDDVLILLNEKDLKIAENVDVPKVLGDVFESIAGAIYLDSGLDLKTVWKVYYRLMWEEIELFSKNIPKNPIRLLFEFLSPLEPMFGNPVELETGDVMVKLDFMLNGSLTRVHGFGDNKKTAKKAVAKVALVLLEASKKH